MRGLRHKLAHITSKKAAKGVSIGSYDEGHTTAASCAFAVVVRIHGHKDVGVVVVEEGVLLVGYGGHMCTRYSNRKPETDSVKLWMIQTLDKIGEMNFGRPFRCETRRAESCSTFLQEAGLRG